MERVDWSEARARFGTPERVTWLVGAHGGSRSICPVGWKMHTSFSPPMVAVSVAPARYTHGLIMESGEFVLAWPGESLAEATLKAGTESGEGGDKFESLGLTPVSGAATSVPLVQECAVNLECVVVNRMPTGDHTIFAAEVVAAWMDVDSEEPLLLAVGEASGYRQVLERGRYRFGVVRP